MLQGAMEGEDATRTYISECGRSVRVCVGVNEPMCGCLQIEGEFMLDAMTEDKCASCVMTHPSGSFLPIAMNALNVSNSMKESVGSHFPPYSLLMTFCRSPANWV